MINDRIDAGKRLAGKIKELDLDNPLVLSIPRGGVVVGDEIAKVLKCKMDVVISKKITPPDNPEYAIGAIAEDGTIYQGPNWEMFAQHPLLQEEIEKKKKEVNRRLEFYRGSTDYRLKDKDVILVDDGIATGSTVLVILDWLAKKEVNQIILAVPVMPADTFEKFQSKVSEIVVLELPSEFFAVGQFYRIFEQVSDEEVTEILDSYKN